MAAPKSVRFLGMGVPDAQDIASLGYDPPALPQDPAALAAAVVQLQNTVANCITAIVALTGTVSTTPPTFGSVTTFTTS